MNWAELPPLNSLRAFSSLAEAGSYTSAAARLDVTHAAVSQQVKSLERRPRVGIGHERPGGASGSPAKDNFWRETWTSPFGTIQRGLERLSDGAANRPVQVTMSPAFATEWLMPRIAEFQQENPAITLLLNPTVKVVELGAGGFDVAIRYQDRRRPHSEAEPVLISDMIVVGAPALLKGRDLSSPRLLARPSLASGARHQRGCRLVHSSRRVGRSTPRDQPHAGEPDHERRATWG